jgi:hypothetical protein
VRAPQHVFLVIHQPACILIAQLQLVNAMINRQLTRIVQRIPAPKWLVVLCVMARVFALVVIQGGDYRMVNVFALKVII